MLSSDDTSVGASRRGPTLEQAAKAIALCRSGGVRDGIEMYMKTLMTEKGPDILPVGLHLQLLEDTGLKDAAAAIRHRALRAGADLCIGAFLGKPPQEIAAEYRQLFARGVGNTVMVAQFLTLLDQLGLITEMASFLDVDRFVRKTEISIVDDGQGGADFWEAVAGVLVAELSNRTWKKRELSLRNLHYIGNLDCHIDKRIQRLLTEIAHHVRQYMALPGARCEAMRQRIPDAYRIDPWAVLSTGDGHNVPHIHAQGWVSGVLFVAGPEAVGPDGYPVGALRVGPPEGALSPVGWPDLAITPKAGTLILMPSYFTHWTLPMAGEGLRISIAFDVTDCIE